MAIDKIFKNSNVDDLADNVLNEVDDFMISVDKMQQQKVAGNVQRVVQAFKKIETNITEKFDNVSNVIEKRVLTIKDGRDGINGKDGRDGKDGRNGKDGLNGKPGLQGPPGKDGIDGADGVSVTNANIDFDGSLIINLSSGQQINAGEVVSPELEKKIIAVTRGGGSSGSVGDVTGPASATDNRIARFDGTTGKLIQNSAVSITDSGNVSGVGTLSASGVATLSAGAVIQGLTVGLGAGAVSSNTAVGVSALSANTTGLAKTAVGYNALLSSTTDNYSTAIGWNALQNQNGAINPNTAIGSYAQTSMTTGGLNVSVGNDTLYSCLTGNDNTALGYQALFSTTGSSNIAVGPASGSGITTGSNNVVIGGYTGSAAPISATGSNWIVLSDGAGNVRGTFNSAGLFDVDGEANISGLTIGKGAGAISDNTAIGVTALNANTTGLSNTAIGYQSLLVNSTGYENASIGSYTLKANTFGNGNTAVGDAALLKNTTGVGNTAIGKSALLENLTGGSNVAVGYIALRDATGSNNTAIGPFAGNAITTGSNNVVIGGYSGTAAPISATGSNYIVLSDGAGTVRQTIDSTGKVGFGTTAPNAALEVSSVTGSATPVPTEVRITTSSSASDWSTTLPWARLGFYSFDASTAGPKLHASISVIKTALNGGTSTLNFNTSDITGVLTERMRIDQLGSVGIGTTAPSASAILDAQSTTKGVRMPNMTTTQKNAIASPAAGLVVFDTTLAKLCVYASGAWQTITSV